MSQLKNVSASVLQRLKNQALAEGRVVLDVQLMYGVERFLYRLSVSDYCDRFVLKGGIALLSLDSRFPRTTRDIDLLGFAANNVEHITTIVREICLLEVEDDGVVFDPNSVRGETIREMDAYSGIRVHFIGYLGTARLNMQIDVGFSNRLVVEAPVVTLDTRLPDFPPPRVQVYPPEAIIAEKFEAFVQLGLLTGHVKDFYDIWFITETQPVDGAALCAALRQTFSQRGTSLPASLDGVLDGFPTDRHRRAWAAMIRKAQKDAAIPPLEEAVARLRALLAAPLARLVSDMEYAAAWEPGVGWSERSGPADS